MLARYLSPLLRGDLPLRGRLPRNWLHRFRGNLGINRLFRRYLSIIRVDRHHLSIIRINRLYVRLDGVLLSLGRGLVATILLLLLLSRRLVARILLLSEGTTLLLVGTDDPAISIDVAALAHTPTTDRGASTRAVSSSP